jgi:hypothetical protein
LEHFYKRLNKKWIPQMIKTNIRKKKIGG